MRRVALLVSATVLLELLSLAAQPAPSTVWSAAQAQSIGTSMTARGRVAGGRRLLNTERPYSYKLAATWFTPEVIAASARLIQLRSRLTDAQAVDLVREAEAAGEFVIMVELDPNEGSGVIPLDWEAFLQPRGATERAVAGRKAPQLRDVKAFAGVTPRNYDYDRFWIAFSRNAPDGTPLFREADREAELVVRIYAGEGRVTWPIPASVLSRSRSLP